MKKILSLIAPSFLLIFLSTTGVFAASYPDVGEDHLNYEAVEYLDDLDIINGYPDGTFKPEDPVNRAEAIKIIVGAFGVEKVEDAEEIFPDVPQGEWFFDFVMSGQKAGVLSGYPDGTFKPGATVNLAETLKMVVLAGKVDLPSTVEQKVFMDVNKDEWYAPHALFARDNNIVFSHDDGKLHAEDNMTRGAFAEVIYRMLIVQETEEPFPLHLNWPEYASKNLPFKIRYDDSSWSVEENGKEVTFYSYDEALYQFSPWRSYPNGATVKVVLDENKGGLNSTQYFANLKLAFPNAKYTEFDLEGLAAMEVLYPEQRIVDWYLYMDSGKVLAIYTEFGNGGLAYLNQQVIKAMLSTFEYSEDTVTDAGDDYETLKSEIFANILMEGKGMEMIDKLPDSVIIETDTIGVGTGPVDYYYSEALNYTFKYERAADVILDKKEGKTSAF